MAKAITVDSVWKGIDAWLEKNAKQAYATLQKGASKAALTKLEKQLGVPLSAELSAHLSVHDGQVPDTGIAIVNNWQLLSCDAIASAHARLGKLQATGVFEGRKGANKDGFVKPVWWNEKWVPLIEGPGGDLVCIDMDPSPKGKAGQVITYFDEVEFRNRDNETMAGYFAGYLNDLTSEYYEVKPNGSLQLQ